MLLQSFLLLKHTIKIFFLCHFKWMKSTWKLYLHITEKHKMFWELGWIGPKNTTFWTIEVKCLGKKTKPWSLIQNLQKTNCISKLLKNETKSLLLENFDFYFWGLGILLICHCSKRLLASRYEDIMNRWATVAKTQKD